MPKYVLKEKEKKHFFNCNNIYHENYGDEKYQFTKEYNRGYGFDIKEASNENISHTYFFICANNNFDDNDNDIIVLEEENRDHCNGSKNIEKRIYMAKNDVNFRPKLISENIIMLLQKNKEGIFNNSYLKLSQKNNVKSKENKKYLIAGKSSNIQIRHVLNFILVKMVVEISIYIFNIKVIYISE